jgi:predicted Zn-dependent protease
MHVGASYEDNQSSIAYLACMRRLLFSVTWLTFYLAAAPAVYGQLDAEGHFKQAMALYKREAYAEALNAIDLAIQAQPKFAAAFVLKGQVYAAQQDYELAIKAYDTALKQDPKLFLARLHRGTARMHINDLDAALTDLNKYLAAIDTDPTGWVQRGMVRARLPRPASCWACATTKRVSQSGAVPPCAAH